jgi:hypothetical protein
VSVKLIWSLRWSVHKACIYICIYIIYAYIYLVMGCTYQAVLGYVASALSNFRSQLEELDPQKMSSNSWAK